METNDAPQHGFFSRDSVALGVLLTLALHLLIQWLFTLVPQSEGLGIAVIGVSQLIYLVPLYLYLRRARKRSAAKGVLLAAALTLLVNAACFGLVLSSFKH